MDMKFAHSKIKKEALDSFKLEKLEPELYTKTYNQLQFDLENEFNRFKLKNAQKEIESLKLKIKNNATKLESLEQTVKALKSTPKQSQPLITNQCNNGLTPTHRTDLSQFYDQLLRDRITQSRNSIQQSAFPSSISSSGPSPYSHGVRYTPSEKALLIRLFTRFGRNYDLVTEQFNKSNECAAIRSRTQIQSKFYRMRSSGEMPSDI